MITKKKLATLKEQLIVAMDDCERTRSEANWFSGYRAAKGYPYPDHEKHYQRELEWWKKYEICLDIRKKTLAAYVRAVRAFAMQ